MFSISKAKRLIGFLFRVFKEADEPFLSKLYKAIVLPHFEYCSCVWDPPFTKYITALERVQSFAAHVVTNTWPLESAPLVESLQWPSLSQRRYFQKLCLCRRILCGSSIIPPSFFPLSTCPLSSHKNSFPLYHSFVRTHIITNPPSNTPWCPFGTKCPMTLLILSFLRTPLSAHFGNTSITLLEPCFSFYFLVLLFSCVSFCFVVIYLLGWPL